MSDFTLFLGKFLRHGTAIASVAPSSRWLSRTTLRKINWSEASCVVELGAGTGPITRAIAELAPAGCRVVVVERDPDFFRLLHERYASRPNFEVIEGDASDLQRLLADRGVTRVDHVISGLPVPSFPVGLQQSLFRGVRTVLNPSGSFNQITELPWVYWRFYRRYFNEVTFAFEPRNFPPAGAYFCRGVKDEV